MTEFVQPSERPEEAAATDDQAEQSIDEVLASEPRASAAVTAGEEASGGNRALALTTEDANLLAARLRQTVLVLAGGVKCGKTSVYAAIYERLSHGPFAGWRFAGSSTIPGFEARCHYWRETAGVDQPGMKHTQAADLPWLHLLLREVEKTGDRLDLLLGDFDGEFFDQLIKNQQELKQLPFLRRADHVGLVVDGERIADPAARPAEEQDLRDLADAMVKESAWSPPSLIFVVTKLDRIEEIEDAGERARIEETLASMHDYVSQLAPFDVPWVRLAVRSETDRFPLGHGLESLLEVLALRPALSLNTDPPEPKIRIPLAEFEA